MKEPGFWYDTQYDDMFMVYPDGQVEFYNHITQEWTDVSSGYEWIWIDRRSRDQFVGEL